MISQRRMAHIFCILALLCFASCVAENTETERGFRDIQLQQDSLPWLDKLQDKQDSMKKQNLAELLYKRSRFENGNIFKGPRDTENQEKNQYRQGSMTTRGLGCRAFFWKTRTAC